MKHFKFTIHIANRFWRDQSGTTSAIALILVTTIIAVGVIVGLATFRNQIIQEFGDVGVAIDSLDQSFDYDISVDTDNDGIADTTVASGMHLDDDDQNNDGIRDAGALEDPVNAAPACLNFAIAPTGE